MSRNIANGGFCPFCNDKPGLREAPRPCTRDDCGVYFNEYQGMIVAHAECPSCGAKFLAWVDGSRRVVHAQPRDLSRQFYDLSFRSTFNEEPGEKDLPKRRVIHHVVWQMGEEFCPEATITDRRSCLHEIHERIGVQLPMHPHRRQQRKTLRALDEARKALQLDADNPALRKVYDDALAAYWSCHQVRNSQRAGIKVNE